jgi:X-Pro dipeptidyl-peptidase
MPHQPHRPLPPFVLAFAVTFAAAVAQDTPPAAERAAPVFKDGQAQVVDAFKKDWIRHDLWVETEFDSDGDGKKDRMHTGVTRPKQTDTEGLKLPVVYETSPYFSGVGSNDKSFFWDPRHELGATPPKHAEPPPIAFTENRPSLSQTEVRTWVPRGFVVVHSASPGTGLSEGCPTVGGSNEAQAPKAVIDWLCGRARGFTSIDGDEEVKATWCSGKVGMIGTSYNGTLPIAAACTGVEGLEAIIPIAPNTSYYHYYRSNGLVRHPGGYMGEDCDVLYDFINSGDPKKREYCNKHVRDGELLQHIDRVTGDFSEWWAARDYKNQLGKFRAALFMAHGWNDWNVMPEHSVRIYEAVKQKGLPVMCFFHQAGHGGPPPLPLMNRWFTRFLHGVDNGVEKDPRSWIVREDQRGNGSPTSYPDYPHPLAVAVTLHPGKGGAGTAALTLAAPGAQGHETLTDDAAVEGAELAMAETSPHRLLYATPTLVEPLHLSGTARVSIRLACDRSATNLSVWLVSLPWEPRGKITSNIITRGWADPQNHASLQKGEPLVPGRFYDVAFDLQPDDQVIAAGERIGLMVFASDHDFTLWPPAGTKLTVDLDATKLVLPVVGGEAAFTRAVTAVTPR